MNTPFFFLGQRVMERIGDSTPDEPAQHQTFDSVIVHAEGGIVTTDLGGTFDVLTGEAVPKGEVYRSIRSVRPSEHRAKNLLGGTEAKP